jgi:hypothetical protein
VSPLNSSTRAVSDPTCCHLHVTFDGYHLITDVVISHPLTMAYIKQGIALKGDAGVAKRMEARKTNKYKQMTEQQEAEFFAFSAESCGGLGPQALAVLKALSAAGQPHLAMWPRYQIIQHMLSSVAVAIQKGNAMAVLSGYNNQLIKRFEKGQVQEVGQAA